VKPYDILQVKNAFAQPVSRNAQALPSSRIK